MYPSGLIDMTVSALRSAYFDFLIAINPPENFSTLCIVQANLSMLTETAEPKMGKNGKKYWTIVFSVEIHFGLTEFKARIKWLDNGHVK